LKKINKKMKTQRTESSLSFHKIKTRKQNLEFYKMKEDVCVPVGEEIIADTVLDSDVILSISDEKKEVLYRDSTFSKVIGVLSIVGGIIFFSVLFDMRYQYESQTYENANAPLPKWSTELAFLPSDFEYCYVGTESGNTKPMFVFCWTMEPDSNLITMAMGAPTNPTSYLAIGFSTNGGMYGADIATYSEKFGLEDRFSTSFSRPHHDPSNKNDLTYLGGSFRNGILSFIFSRPLKVCFEHDDTDLDIRMGENYLIWAIGPVSTDINYHSSRGSFTLNLVTPYPQSSSSAHLSFQQLEIRMNNGTSGQPLSLNEYVTETDTYICVGMPFSPLSEPHHIFEVDALVENPNVVHHMILYHCMSALHLKMPPSG
jgi:hypothetical protein